MEFQIDPSSRLPIHRQLRAQIREAVARGRMQPQERLPSVRELSRKLVVNPNTVARAYSLLEQQGMVATRTGAGAFVCDPGLRDHDAAQLNHLAERMDTIIAQGLNLGFEAEDLTDMFRARLGAFARRQQRQGKDKS